MSVSAETLRDFWEDELAAAAAETPLCGSGDTPGEAKLIPLLRSLPIPVLQLDPAWTWLWSDLHLGDPAVLAGRPFESVAEMTGTLLDNWRRCIGLGDTIVCLGDVGHADAWADPELEAALAACPGQRLLVIGRQPRRQLLRGARPGRLRSAVRCGGVRHDPAARSHARAASGASRRRPSTCTATCTTRTRPRRATATSRSSGPAMRPCGSTPCSRDGVGIGHRQAGRTTTTAQRPTTSATSGFWRRLYIELAPFADEHGTGRGVPRARRHLCELTSCYPRRHGPRLPGPSSASGRPRTTAT